MRRQKLIGKSLKLHGRAGMKTAARWVNKRAKINVGDLDEAAHKSDDESAGLAQGTRALLLLALVALRLRRCARVPMSMSRLALRTSRCDPGLRLFDIY